MSRFCLCFLALASICAFGQKPDATAPPAAKPVVTNEGPLSAIQQLFDAMASRDALAAQAAFVPDAAIFSLGANGKAVKMPLKDFLDAIGSGKKVWKERVWDIVVHEHGSIAVVWAPYDFHNDGVFSHCGYDSFSLIKTSVGWKIAYVSDTRETSGCSNPLGPPPAQ